MNGTASAIASDHLWSTVQQCGFLMCVHKRKVGCTYPYIPECAWCAETIHRVPLLDVPLFHVCTCVILPYFPKAAFVKIFIRKIFRLKAEKRL